MRSFVKYIAISQIFITAISPILCFIIPVASSYKLNVVGMGFLTIISVLDYFTQSQAYRNAIFKALLISLIIILFYWFTSMSYLSDSDKYSSFFLVLLGQFLPVSMISSSVACDEETILGMKRLAPTFSIALTVISFVAAFFPTGVTSGGYVDNENGLNYQTTAYVAAYAASMSIYYILSYDSMSWGYLWRSILGKWICIGALVVNLLTIFISGGRGGLVLYIILLLVGGYLKIQNDTSVQKIKKVILALVFLTVLISLLVTYSLNTSIETNGFYRIVYTLEYGDSNGRGQLRDIALTIFSDKPLFGHGLGSVFYEMGSYSHNIVTDILVERGLIGFLIFTALIYFVVSRLREIIRIDKTDMIWGFVFIDGIVLLLFSGYYLASTPLIWTIFFLWSYPHKY